MLYPQLYNYSSHLQQVAIIGGGYAGLAAAITLCKQSIPVTVFEASQTLGGRARAVFRHDAVLDNGQHILIGAYTSLLGLMEEIGVKPESVLRRVPLCLHFPGHFSLRLPILPAPFHLFAGLACARGMSLNERWQAVRFAARMRGCNFQLAPSDRDETVASLLNRYDQPATLRRYLWEPLCLAAMNTLPVEASAQIFLNVLRDSLSQHRAASDMLLPITDLSNVFPNAAEKFIQTHGGSVERGVSIRSLKYANSMKTGFTLEGDTQNRIFSHVISAVAPHQLAVLIESVPELQKLAQDIQQFKYEPITTCYLAYPSHVKLRYPMVGMTEGMTQWLFDRGQLGGPAGLLASVMSTHGLQDNMTKECVVENVHKEIETLMGPLPQPAWTQVIREKRATFACRAGLVRPDCVTPLSHFLLCGDYVASDYPATLESAVRSGIRCAQQCTKQCAKQII